MKVFIAEKPSMARELAKCLPGRMRREKGWISNKGVILGRLIGQSLQAEEIPPAFCRVIRAAGTFASVRGKQEKEMNL